MIPSVSIQKTDGNLGVATATERILAIIGTSSQGDFDKPYSFSSKNDLVAAFGSGPLVEAGAYMLSLGVPCVFIRSDPTTDGAYGTIDDSGVSGSSSVSGGSSTPDGNYDVIVEILKGGTVGSAGITYRFSLDNGVNWSEPQALGTATTLECARGVEFDLDSSETLLDGDTWSCRTTAPKILTGDLGASLAALRDYSGEWLRLLVLTDADATILAQLDTFAKSFWADGKFPEVITCTRPRDIANSEDRATYQAALAAIAGAVQSTEVSCCADHCELVSEVNGWRLRLPSSIPYAARLMIIDDSQDAAAKADGALPGVFLETAEGARDYHDERRYPGLDALGFTTLRTWGGRPVTPGVYVNNPRLISGPGSDFRYFQHTAILNRAIEKTYKLFENRLSQAVLVDPDTGRIREDVAKALEDTITAELRTEFQDSGRCSAIRIFISRTDNILVTDTITFDLQMVPLAYTKKFIGKAGLVKRLAAAA